MLSSQEMIPFGVILSQQKMRNSNDASSAPKKRFSRRTEEAAGDSKLTWLSKQRRSARKTVTKSKAG